MSEFKTKAFFYLSFIRQTIKPIENNMCCSGNKNSLLEYAEKLSTVIKFATDSVNKFPKEAIR